MPFKLSSAWVIIWFRAAKCHWHKIVCHKARQTMTSLFSWRMCDNKSPTSTWLKRIGRALTLFYPSVHGRGICLPWSLVDMPLPLSSLVLVLCSSENCTHYHLAKANMRCSLRQQLQRSLPLSWCFNVHHGAFDMKGKKLPRPWQHLTFHLWYL